MCHPVYPGGIWLIDFEFHPQDGIEGNPLSPVCMVALNILADTVNSYWRDELLQMEAAPFPTDSSALIVAYNASAEMSCFRVLNWPVPVNILDLYAEFRNATNGLLLPAGKGLLGALIYFGEPHMATAAKDAMRELILGCGPWTEQEQQTILKYCAADVIALARLYLRMEEKGLIDWRRGSLRGHYSIAAAAVEHTGIPIDTDILALLRGNACCLRDNLIASVDQDYGVFENGHFRAVLFALYLKREGLSWPYTEGGRLDLRDETFRDMARSHPQMTALHQLRQSLVQLREIKLTVGGDGRNRFTLFPYSSVTGRNQPSTSKFIFGLSNWLRGLIRPASGMALAYLDYSQQELAIAAALSGDAVMQEAYLSGDFYMTFAIQSGAAPASATKASHPEVRERYKQCALAVLYGMGDHGLAARLGISVSEAQQLLKSHHRTYSRFWQWSDAAVDCALLTGKIWTVFGWQLHVERNPNVRRLRNFPMQANGAEMLRLACNGLVSSGISVCATIHDAVLVEAPVTKIESTVADSLAIMREASRIVLGGFEINCDVKIVRHPDRYMDAKGAPMWNRVMGLLDRPDAMVTLGEIYDEV